MLRLFFLSLVIFWLFAATSPSQEPARIPPTPPPATIPAAPDYPDSTSGLEHLAKDIIKAQRENDGPRAEALLRSLILPTPRLWYETTFGPTIARSEGMLYASATPSLPATLAGDFLNAQTQHFSHLEAHRYDKTCDDDAGEFAFGILHARLEPVPLYEIRFMVAGNQFLRMYAFVYVDGGFRFILPPKLEGNVFAYSYNSTPKSSAAVAVGSDTHPSPSSDSGTDLQRVRIGGPVQAAKIVYRVEPTYPEKARRERLQGTVTLHALITKDGSIRKLYVLKGYCSLAEASVLAVKQWRYKPTLLNGEPVEVDTAIQVIYQLQR